MVNRLRQVKPVDLQHLRSFLGFPHPHTSLNHSSLCLVTLDRLSPRSAPILSCHSSVFLFFRLSRFSHPYVISLKCIFFSFPFLPPFCHVTEMARFLPSYVNPESFWLPTAAARSQFLFYPSFFPVMLLCLPALSSCSLSFVHVTHAFPSFALFLLFVMRRVLCAFPSFVM